MNIGLVKSKLIAFKHILKGWGKPSFSQVGEDIILNYLFISRGIARPTYLDVGASEPVAGSNTYFFYHRGSTGVCIEPDPELYRKIRQIRPRDICLNIGIGLTETSEAPFYVFASKYKGWNTFSKEEAEVRKNSGHPYDKVLKMPLKNINDIIKETLGEAPDILSIDVEGLDLEILQSLNFNTYCPKVLVVETIRFGDSVEASKQQNIINFVCSKGYTVYADTYVNTIFIKSGF